jgi:hypothetical protein
MTGQPVLTDQWAQEYNRLRSTVVAAMTAARARIKFAKLVAAQLLVSSATGHRIIINPDDATDPEIWLVPADSGTNYSRIRSRDNINAGEAVLQITSGENAGGTASAELELGSGSVRMQIHDSDGSGDNGGYADWGLSRARFGYLNGSTDNYFDFSASSISRHHGQWDDFGSLPGDAGILSGSWTLASGFVGATVHYPTTMDSNMGPVASLRDGAANPNFDHCLTASTQSSYDHDWSPSGGSSGPLTGKAGYFWSFRH